MRILVVSSPLAGYLSPLLPVIGALVDAGEVVVVSGPAAESLVERTGATFQRAGNDSAVWFARFVAQAELLPRCSVIVQHGGAGTTFGALAHGVPQAIVPQGADNFDNAAMCERAGMALVLHPDKFSSTAVADSVFFLLNDPRFTDAARCTANEIAVMPDPAAVATVVHEYQR